MMDAFPTRFQIRDLEEFSGVKAHTIRIWEKRYGLLRPDRTDTNIRQYGLDELKTILNVAFLNRNGWKISKIATMPQADRDALVGQVASASGSHGETLNALKMAMLSFDEPLFEGVSARYAETAGFRSLVEEVYVPLLEQIGVLWQANSICPAHEHFVSNLIRQRLVTASNTMPPVPARTDRVHVLYLPENEVHELGLLYVNHLLRTKGERTIYLGQSVPREDLRQVVALFDGEVVLVSVLTANPPVSEVPDFLRELRGSMPEARVTFLVAGSQLARVPDINVPEGMALHPSMASLIAAIGGS